MVADAWLPVTVALLAAGLLIAVARMLGLGLLRAAVAALAGGALATLIATELTIGGAGDWWQDHPSASATVTGVLLLALTVLLVEAAVKRALDAVQANRWRLAGQVAATRILAGLASPIRDFQDEVMWVMGEGVEARMNRWPRDDPDHRARVLLDQISEVVLPAALVMTATDRLHLIYAHALEAARIASELVIAIPAWQRESADDAALLTPAGESARLDWWGDIGAPWHRLVEAAAAFEDDAKEHLGATVEYEPWEPPWRERPSEQYARALSDFLNEYDQRVAGRT